MNERRHTYINNKHVNRISFAKETAERVRTNELVVEHQEVPDRNKHNSSNLVRLSDEEGGAGEGRKSRGFPIRQKRRV